MEVKDIGARDIETKEMEVREKGITDITMDTETGENGIIIHLTNRKNKDKVNCLKYEIKSETFHIFFYSNGIFTLD